ncbi:M24 family metallopeptidase [Halanaerobacter jeridensis]|uniref:Xaa-Pro dipeptidase n=1 Tax=Halanaerobacter jeridensis TaxID=706427 RepID=A0A938XS10_9FIRM|nr:Xaa-Pro peptidase family protein [Halanaerobacter jeridensis]MBM7555769.1 Xaa-Pro dipeptidase [Halanaerobacter jeridensis]
MKIQSQKELKRRISKLQHKLRAKDIGAALIIQNADLFYFTGTVQGEYLYVPSQGDAVLFVSDNNKRVQNETPLEKITTVQSPSELPRLIKKEGGNSPSRLGLELDVLPYKTTVKLQEIFDVDKVSNITTLIRQVRMIKSDFEIEMLREAAEKLAVVPNLVKEHLTSEMSELELSAIIEQGLREKGHAGFIRMRGLNNEIPMGICTAGKQAISDINIDAICAGAGVDPSAGIGASKQKIGLANPIILDYMATHNGYIADQTRMAIAGSASDYIQELYDKMRYLEKQLSQYLTPEYSCDDIYQQGIELAKELGVIDYYLGSANHREKFVGHGIGVELNEFPFLASGLDFKLKAGMTIALEPKLVIPDIGVIGIENDYVVTEKKPKKLTTADEELIIV